MFKCGPIGIDENGETPFVRGLSYCFEKLAIQIVKRPWTFIFISSIITLITVIRIPFTPMTNDVSDFTPAEARARKEVESYKAFFSNKGTPVALYALITAKNNTNMFGINQLADAVTVMDLINDKFTVYNTKLTKNETFREFCGNFCTLNEPIRHFYSGLLVESQYRNTTSASHIDLGYPITTVLGRQLRMDPNFFGVKVAIPKMLTSATEVTTNETLIVSVNEVRSKNGHSIFDQNIPQLPNNIRGISMIGLQFRAERPSEISTEEIKNWELSIVKFFQHEFKSDFVKVLILTESHLTEEIVTAGLTLIPFLLVGFIIMATFSSITMSLAAVYMKQMHYTKIILAILACIVPFMATGTSLGLLFYMGFRFGTILCVTPFLVLAISVDDAYLMINSWQRIRKEKLELDDLETTTINDKTSSTSSSSEKEILKSILAGVFIDTAPSITITTLTNVLAFGVGALTPTPEIQLFSIGNAVAIIIDYIYQWTVYGSFMAIYGRIELSANNKIVKEEENIEKNDEIQEENQIRARIVKGCNKFIKTYSRCLTNPFISSLIMALLAVYFYISLYGIFNTRAELQPEKLFLKTSDVLEILHLRNEYVMPFYAVCMVFVNNPGNLSNPLTVQKWNNLVKDFEELPSSLGKFSTKYWMRDYQEFIQNAEEAARLVSEEVEDLELEGRKKNELRQFFEWPEFQHWHGFVYMTDDGKGGDMNLEKFFFTVASFGPELKEWSNRAKLLEEWRKVADSYPELNVTIYEDDAKFLDLIPTMVPQTAQSSFWTFVCMILVCLLVMTHPTTVLVASLAIFSTCLGVFGFLSLWGIELDPIVMSCGIMSIGFSVDIPAHIAYHFYKSGLGKHGSSLSVPERIEHTLISVGFPVIEAGISTNICVMTLLFVDLHMAQVFVKTMVLVVSIGLVHGLVIIPVVFYLLSLLPNPWKKSPKFHDSAKMSAASTAAMIYTVEK